MLIAMNQSGDSARTSALKPHRWPWSATPRIFFRGGRGGDVI